MLFIFYWSIVDLQCYVSFRCIAKWLSYAYTYIYFFLILFLQVMHPSIHRSTIFNSQDTCLLRQHIYSIAKTWKQLECPLTEEWIEKMWNIQWNITQSQKGWNNVIFSNMVYLIILLSEGRQAQKDKYYMVLLICGSKKNDTNELICKIDSQT